MNYFLYLVKYLSKICFCPEARAYTFSFVYVPWKNIYKINQHWQSNYSIQCCPCTLIDLKANSLLYLDKNYSNIVLQEHSCFNMLTVSGKQYQKMSWINIEHNIAILCIVIRKDWFILKRIPVFIWYNILKKISLSRKY